MSRILGVLTLVSLCFSCGNPNGTGTDGGAGPTYYKDVLPITQSACNGCHTAGGIGPFALDTYADAKLRAPNIANAVENKRMPPWPAAKTCGGPFVGDRTLSDEQIATLVQWNATGAAEGNAADAPQTMTTIEELPRVDLTRQMPTTYSPTAKDDYRCFILDPQLAQQEVVIGYDISPGSKKVVHHVIMYIVPRTRAQAKDAEDAAPGWECFGGANVTTNGTLGAWAPGGSAIRFPANTGIRINPNEVIAMQVHYNTDNGTDVDQTSIKLMYGTGAEKSAFLLPLVADNFNIPAKAQNYAHSESFPNSLGFPLYLWGFLPHMHTKGKTIKMSAGATDDCLVDIPQWDFHWQNQYFRKTAYQLTASSSVKLSCTWDNPTNQAVTWGEGTSDEMCFAFVYATP